MNIIPNITAKDYLLPILIKQKELGYRGRESSPIHLNSAIVEWNINGYWNNDDAVIISTEDKGFIFLLYTFQKDINGVDKLYCEIRHIVTLEQFRGQGIGKRLFEVTVKHMNQNNCKHLKVLSDKKSTQFYKKVGLKESGITKHGLSYFCNNTDTLQPTLMPASDFPFMIDKPNSIL